MSDKCWLDVIDVALCHLSSFAPEGYTELVAQAHGWLQCVLAGTAGIESLLLPAAMPYGLEVGEAK